MFSTVTSARAYLYSRDCGWYCDSLPTYALATISGGTEHSVCCYAMCGIELGLAATRCAVLPYVWASLPQSLLVAVNGSTCQNTIDD
eukprot:1908269-Rhodomonas_salina.2